jgi:hypothetical protein
MNTHQFISARHFLLSPCGLVVCGYFVWGDLVKVVTVDGLNPNWADTPALFTKHAVLRKQTARGHWVDRADHPVPEKRWTVVRGDTVPQSALAQLEVCCAAATAYVRDYNTTKRLEDNEQADNSNYSNYALEA